MGEVADGRVELAAVVGELVETHGDRRRPADDDDGDSRPARPDVEPVDDADGELLDRRPVDDRRRRVEHQRQVDQRLAATHRACVPPRHHHTVSLDRGLQSRPDTMNLPLAVVKVMGYEKVEPTPSPPSETLRYLDRPTSVFSRCT